MCVHGNIAYFYFAAWHPGIAVDPLQCNWVKLALVEVDHGDFCRLVLGSLWGTENKLEIIPVKNIQMQIYLCNNITHYPLFIFFMACIESPSDRVVIIEIKIRVLTDL